MTTGRPLDAAVTRFPGDQPIGTIRTRITASVIEAWATVRREEAAQATDKLSRLTVSHL
jgi:hypothetical protein